jgi:hypothetical protein
MKHPDEHTCFYRGCREIVIGRYHCPRHEAILEARRASQSRRNAARAAGAQTGAQVPERA